MSESQEWVVGFHAVKELLNQNTAQVSQLVLASNRNDKRVQEIRQLAERNGVAVEEADKKKMDQRFEGVHQGVAALCQFSSRSGSENDLFSLLEKLDHPPLLLILDGVTDPHNLGACLRTADAAGVDAVIVPKDKSAPLNATVRKVASGAAETVNFIVVTNLSRCLQKLQAKGVWLVGAADDTASTLYSQDLSGPIALLMGAEGSGLRRLTRESCDYLVTIPMAGSVSSLNVSVATGICLYEAVRQRSPN